jgi:polyphenol oxidase
MAPKSATLERDSELWAESPPILQSELLLRRGFRHAFFTRQGGVSKGPYDSLNFATATGDSQENVDENKRRAAKALGVDSAHIFVMSQVHGKGHALVGPQTDARTVAAQEGDIVVTKSPVAAAIRTADCVPVLLACAETRLVAACHAGWKGCVIGAIFETVRVMRELGASELVAAIGPHISRAAFEIEEDVAAQLLASSPDPDIIDKRQGRLYGNLRKMARAQLRSVGLRADAIDDVLGCTVFDEAQFFSFRRDGERSGRMLSAIVGQLSRA